ncbi:MAG: hypothetical protein M1817_001847 [Caeruleum heppii]|nr:MAG: hypothetical protein M1817_001847 [Caeruleum heppii]
MKALVDMLVRRQMVPMAPAPPGVEVHLDELTYKGWTNEAAFNQAVVTILMMVITTFFVAMRIYTKARIARALGLDDWVCLLAWGFIIAQMSMTVFMFKHGFGAHAWDISLDMFHKRWFVFIALNGLLVTIEFSLVKLAILLLYLRIFKIERTMRWVIYGIIYFVLGYTIGGVLAIVFACDPISKNWDWTVTEGQCHVSAFPLGTSLNILNIITDVATLVAPFPIVWKLQLSMRQKVGVMIMFTLGTSVCVATLARVVLFQTQKNNPDLFYTFYRINWAALFEVSIGEICACLPAMRHFGRVFVPWLRSLTPTASAFSLSSRLTRSSRQQHPKSDSNNSDEYGGPEKDSRLHEASSLELGSAGPAKAFDGSVSTHGSPVPYRSNDSREAIVGGRQAGSGEASAAQHVAYPQNAAVRKEFGH